MLLSLWNDENGFIISAELVLVLTVGVLALVVGLHSLAKAINHELVDLASAFGNLSQGYEFSGFRTDCPGPGGRVPNAAVEGSAFDDTEDACDCAILIHTPPLVKVGQGAGGQG